MYQYSFIIPHHNNPILLNRCIETIPQRNDIEIIVVDDNSDDNKHPNNLRSDVKLITIDSIKSKGAGRARNYGITKAKGKWLLFADCDDFYEKGFIEELDHFSNNENIDIIYFGVYYAYDICNHESKWKTNYDIYLKKCLESDYDEFWVKTVKHSLQTPWNFMIRHSYVSMIHAYFEEVPKGNDAYFHHYVAMHTNKIVITEKKIYYYIWSDDGLTHRKKTKEQIIANTKHSIQIDHLRAKAEAWHTIRPYYINICPIIKKYGLILGLKVLYIKLKYGEPLLLLLWYRFIFWCRLSF